MRSASPWRLLPDGATIRGATTTIAARGPARACVVRHRRLQRASRSAASTCSALGDLPRGRRRRRLLPEHGATACIADLDQRQTAPRSSRILKLRIVPITATSASCRSAAARAVAAVHRRRHRHLQLALHGDRRLRRLRRRQRSSASALRRRRAPRSGPRDPRRRPLPGRRRVDARRRSRWQQAEGDTGGIDEGFLGDKIDLGGIDVQLHGPLQVLTLRRLRASFQRSGGFGGSGLDGISELHERGTGHDSEPERLNYSPARSPDRAPRRRLRDPLEPVEQPRVLARAVRRARRRLRPAPRSTIHPANAVRALPSAKTQISPLPSCRKFRRSKPYADRSCM